jgi:hypothetical protein
MAKSSLGSKGLNMQTSKHDSQLRYFLKLTRFGVFRWRRTPNHRETFMTAMKSYFVVTVWEDEVKRYFKQESLNEEAQLLVTSADSDVVDAIFSRAKSQAFNLYGATPQIGRLDS